MPVRRARRSWRFLLVPGLALLLASSNAACGGSADDDPSPTPSAAAPQTVTAVEPPEPEPPIPSAETTPTSIEVDAPGTETIESSSPAETDVAASAVATLDTGPEADVPGLVEPPVPDPPTVMTERSVPAPSPPPAPELAPAPHPGIALIEPAPGAFEQRTFATGERIDWTHGIFVLDPETGLTEGYAVAESMQDSYHSYWLHSGGWIFADGARVQPSFLLHRATGQSWGWPPGTLWLAAASREHLLFAEWIPPAHDFTGRFTIANRAMEELAHFSIAGGDYVPRAFFSPDGQTIALGVANSVYLIAVESARPTVLFQAGTDDSPTSVWIDLRYKGPGFLVRAYYRKESAKPIAKSTTSVGRTCLSRIRLPSPVRGSPLQTVVT